MHRLLLTGLLLVAALAHAEPELAPYEAEYKVKFSIFGGRLTTRLQQLPDTYSATHALETTGMSRMLASGSIEEQSVFERDGTSLLANTFTTQDELTDDETNANFAFDWAAGSVAGSLNGAAVSMPLESGTLDRVSIQYQLMQDMLSDSLKDEYRMFDLDETKVLEIENIGPRRIKTSAGSFDAVGIRHQSPGSSRSTTFWMVPELGYAPALIEQHRKDKLRLKATLTRFTALTDAPASLQGE